MHMYLDSIAELTVDFGTGGGQHVHPPMPERHNTFLLAGRVPVYAGLGLGIRPGLPACAASC